MTKWQSRYYSFHHTGNRPASKRILCQPLGGTNLDFRIRRIGWNCGRHNNQAGLWTDSRYFLQAAQQLEDSGFELFKEGLPDTPTIEQWLLTTLPQGATIAIDGTLFGASKAAAMKQNFESHGFRFVSDFTPFDSIWEKRPSIPKNEAFIHDEKYSGESISDKIARIMEQVRQAGADALLLAALDEIAWAFNIRGTDVECNRSSFAMHT